MVSGIINGLWLFVLGCLAVPALVLSKRPDAKQVLDKIAPYQGWIGLISAIYGLVRIPYLISALSFFKLGFRGILAFVIVAAFVVTMIVLGFILGIGVLKSFVKDANAQAKMDQLLNKVLPSQTLFGLIAIFDGIALIVTSIAPSILF